MKNFKIFQYIFIGILFWIIISSIALLTVIMPANKDIQLPYYLPVILKNAHGIHLGTRVHILGVDQGFVKHIDYYPVDNNGNLILITNCENLCEEKIKDQIILAILNIRRKMEFYQNYHLYTRYDNVIGEKIIEIDPGSKLVIKKNTKTIIPKIEVLYLNPSEVLEIITNNRINLNKQQLILSTNYEDPLTIFSEIIFENRKPLFRIFKNLAETTEKINSGKGTISLLLNENILLTEIDKTFLEAILFIRDLREGLESLRENNILINSASPITGFSDYFIK